MSVDVWSHLERLGDAEAGEISALASAPLGARRIATAVRNAAGNIKVIVWEVEFDGSIERLGSGEGGTTTRVAIAPLGNKRFVTAARTEAGTLKLTVWDVDEAGQITRRESGETGEIHGEFALLTFSTYRVVTAVRDAKDRLKLISWHVHAAGSVQRLSDALAGEVGQIAIATYDPYPPSNGCLATAVTTKSGNLKIIGWSIDTAGVFKRLGDIEGGPVKDVVASTLSHRRIVTAARNLQNQLDVQTWDFDAQGNVSLHSSGQAGEISSLATTTLNAARVITAVRDAAGNLKLIVWDAIDDVVRLDAASAGTVGLLSIVPLGSDWIVTPVQTATNTLKVIAWREHAVSLLCGQWPPLSPQIDKLTEMPLLERVSSEDDDKELRGAIEPIIDSPPFESFERERTPNSPPMLSIPFEPGIEGKDPMIAVGFKYVIVTQQAELAFFDKKGDQLKDKNGKWVRLSTREFFSTFLAGQRPDGSRNEHCINRHTGFPPHGHTDLPPSVNCDPDAKDANGRPLPPAVREFYDTRVHFDPVSRRFFIFAPARTTKFISTTTNLECFEEGDNCPNTNKADNPFNRRYWAFAVSKTEDPRDGFHQWMSTEAYIADGPEFTVNQGLMVVAKYVKTEYRDIQPIGMKPLVYVFSVEDLLQGRAYPRSHKLFRPDFPSYTKGDVCPVTHYGDTAGRTFFVKGEGIGGINVFSFKNPSDWRNFPSVDHTPATLVVGGENVYVSNPWQAEHPKFRDGKIYFTWVKHVVEPVPNGKNGLYAIWLVRMPLKALSTKPAASVNKADGFLNHLFLNNAADDDPDDKVSYERPTITVNKEGHMVILFCRVGYDTKDTLHPEARYIVYYADDRGLRGSQVLRKGEFTPMWKNPDHPKPRQLTIKTPNDQLDYQTAVVDPSDDRTVWMISEYADKEANGYKTVVGKVTP